jgi:hypothetical protein
MEQRKKTKQERDGEIATNDRCLMSNGKQKEMDINLKNKPMIRWNEKERQA